jgi:hypothetical protein
MRSIASEIEDKVDELLACLDKDVRHIEESLSHLNELRSLVIKRDDAALSGLLESLRARSDLYAGHESNRLSIRRDLAIMLGCKTEQMTLTALASCLPEGKKEAVIEIQTKLRSLTGQLKTEHMSTALLLSECARFNSLLLRSLFDLGQTGAGAVYYNSSGTAKRQMDGTLMNLQL